jgi:hypothetical protein
MASSFAPAKDATILARTFAGAKDSHMGVGWTGFDQAECVLSSGTPPIVAFCLLLVWRRDGQEAASVVLGITSRHTGISGE